MVWIPFHFLVRKCKDRPNSSNLVTPKTKEVRFLGAPAAGSQSSILLDTMNGDVEYFKDGGNRQTEKGQDRCQGKGTGFLDGDA